MFEKPKLISCYKCGGTGRLTIKVDNGISVSQTTLACVYCLGEGTMTPELYVAAKQMDDQWCRCNQPMGVTHSRYDRDYYYCGSCNKLVQTG